MKILVTAGGISESLDSVRSITNHSSGRLGSLIADEFITRGFDLTYVCTEKAVHPKLKVSNIVKVRSSTHLLDTLRELIKENDYSAFIHSMAVSDYSPSGLSSFNAITSKIIKTLETCETLNNSREIIKKAVLSAFDPLTGRKMSSEHSDIFLHLKSNPKVIECFKTLCPKAVLVGFKLLSDVPEDELVNVATSLLIRNSCDYVLANDIQDIRDDIHKAILIDKNGILQKVNTKQEIAVLIANTVKERIANQ